MPTGAIPCIIVCTSISFTDIHFQYACRSVSPLRGCASSMFHAEYNHRSKFIRSELMNTPGRGILWHLHEKISRPRFPAVAHLVFFRASAEHPFAPVVQWCQRANKLQTAIIRIKKISPYDTERQIY